MSRVDLHIHSTASDGKFSPEAIVARAAEYGLTIIALADHDSVDGIAPALEAARVFPQLRVIPGVEISTDAPRGEVHMLGYFIDYSHQELLATLSWMRDSRQKRAQGMIAKLANLGLLVEWEIFRNHACLDANDIKQHERNYIWFRKLYPKQP